MLWNAQLLEGFWTKALATTIHLINTSPNKRLDMRVAKELWLSKPPSYKHLKVFGCEAYCHILKENQNKLEPKSRKCIFLGYGESGEMGFRLWDQEAKKIVHSHSVFFNKSKMQTKPVKTMLGIKSQCGLSYGQPPIHTLNIVYSLSIMCPQSSNWNRGFQRLLSLSLC